MIELGKIADFAQLAAIIEASSFKPGNVDPLHDFKDTKYEDFLFGAVAIRSAIEDSVTLGFMAGKGKIPPDNIRIGGNIKRAVYDVKESHKGGNTHLGTAMLFVPMSAGAGVCIAEGSEFNPKFNSRAKLSKLRQLRCRIREFRSFDFPNENRIKKSLQKNISNIIKNSTIEDSLDFYAAVTMANAGGLNGKLIEKRIPFYELMEISAKKDRIAEELSSGMKIAFDIGYPLLKKFYDKRKSIREATTGTYLNILAEFPDTLIAKKVGLEKAKIVSRSAKLVLKGEKSIADFDRELRYRKNELNPGTTADIVAASIFVWLLMREF